LKFSFTKILDKLKSLFNFKKKESKLHIHDYQDRKELDKKLVFGMAKSRIPSLTQWKYLRKSFTEKESFIFNTAVILLVLSLLFLGVRLYQEYVYLVPEEGGQYVEAAIGAPKYINPIFSQTNDVDGDLSRLIYSSLIKYNKESDIDYDLLEKYELSEDQKVYTFHIKKNIKWHDGESLTVNDILFTIELAQNEEIDSPLYLNLAGVQTEKVDDYTFKLTLSEPFAPFLSPLNFGILPQHLYKDVPFENIRLVEYNLKPIGSGPFKFKTLTRGSFGEIKKFTMKKNEEYYAKKPYLDEIIFRFYPDLPSAVGALKNKNVEGISYISKEYEEELPQKLNINYYHLNLPQYTAVFYNTKNEILENKKIREALSFATNKNEIINDVLNGIGETVHGPILKGFFGYTEEVKDFIYNPDEARHLLDDAGWTIDEEKGVRTKDDKELKFNLTTLNQPEYMKVAEKLKEYWNKIGCQVETIFVESDRIEQKVIKDREYDSILYGEIIGYDPDPYPFWHSSQQQHPGLNLSIYYNKKIDKILEEARKIPDPEKRAEKYAEFSKIIAEEQPALFLYSPYYTYGLSKNVKGFDLTRIVSPQDRFNQIQEWYINTKRAWK